VPESKPSTQYTAEEWQQLLVAGGKYSGLLTVKGAVHLLTFTELPHHRAFPDLVEVERVHDRANNETYTAAFVKDWAALPDSKAAIRLPGGDTKLLALAVSMVSGTPVSLRDNLVGFGHAHIRRVIEAVAMATGGDEFYAVTPTPALDEMLAARDALFG